MKDIILFHPFKHHLAYIKQWIAAATGNISSETMQTIKTIGSSQMDMYCGVLTVDEIIQQVAGNLQLAGINTAQQAKHWLGNGYKLVTLNDGSSFTLRYINNSRPVHIHPSRYAPHVVRVKANALKTAICYRLLYANKDKTDTSIINTIRMQYLRLSPVAGKQGIAEIEKAIRLLE
ncbi:MAG TPA: hypothetical protein VHB48_18140 [Chitinophagaceae bacterium]|nr:hypothetical protein [Chitinophagaceae bacterium]